MKYKLERIAANEGFTLMEMVIAVMISAIGFVFIASAVKMACSTNDDAVSAYLMPEVESARARQSMAEEMKRQNDLLERQIQLQENQSNNTAEKP